MLLFAIILAVLTVELSADPDKWHDHAKTGPGFIARARQVFEGTGGQGTAGAATVGVTGNRGGAASAGGTDDVEEQRPLLFGDEGKVGGTAYDVPDAGGIEEGPGGSVIATGDGVNGEVGRSTGADGDSSQAEISPST